MINFTKANTKTQQENAYSLIEVAALWSLLSQDPTPTAKQIGEILGRTPASVTAKIRAVRKKGYASVQDFYSDEKLNKDKLEFISEENTNNEIAAFLDSRAG